MRPDITPRLILQPAIRSFSSVAVSHSSPVPALLDLLGARSNAGRVNQTPRLAQANASTCGLIT
nr:MAG TPA: hypothetical protein [Caudoviricetes sp.]